MRLFLLVSLLAATLPTPGPPLAHARAAQSLPVSPDELFSRRALRRARLLIQMRVMQFREERLECIRAALRRQLPHALWPELPSPTRGTPGTGAAVARCEDAQLDW